MEKAGGYAGDILDGIGLESNFICSEPTLSLARSHAAATALKQARRYGGFRITLKEGHLTVSNVPLRIRIGIVRKKYGV